MSEDWSRFEVEATVTDYFAMLAKELRGEPFNKAEHNRSLLMMLSDRTRGAIEFKHANISAVMIEIGYPYIEGYQPRSNYQELLRDVISERLAISPSLQAAARQAVDRPARQAPAFDHLAGIIVPPPIRDPGRHASYERPQPPRQPMQGVNYLAREAMNASLGLAGEEFVLRVEHARLLEAGQRRLADRVEHVARTRGDGLGYDILSFEPNGRERLVEVKTTRFGALTPFFATRNEVDASAEQAAQYHVYRVFSFDDHRPKLFMLPGSLRESCTLDPVRYRASVV
ncbi:MAG: DUF3883 domain-containing protein [Gemmatimonadaceae bacterium]